MKARRLELTRMGQEKSIGQMRVRISDLVEQEAVLLSQALELSRERADRAKVDALFARVQAMQVERNGLKKEIASVLGSRRMHVASEVRTPGVYDYREEVGGDTVRVVIIEDPEPLVRTHPASMSCRSARRYGCRKKFQQLALEHLAAARHREIGHRVDRGGPLVGRKVLLEV